MRRVSSQRIVDLQKDEVFVFGSNKNGFHGGGAAAFAMMRFGAEWGVGEGMTGQTYALPTMEGRQSTEDAVGRFVEFAKEHPEKRFLVTEIGCGIAGYTPEDIAPMFRDAMNLENVFLPERFWNVLASAATV